MATEVLLKSYSMKRSHIISLAILAIQGIGTCFCYLGNRPSHPVKAAAMSQRPAPRLQHHDQRVDARQGPN